MCSIGNTGSYSDAARTGERYSRTSITGDHSKQECTCIIFVKPSHLVMEGHPRLEGTSISFCGGDIELTMTNSTPHTAIMTEKKGR